MCDVHSVFVQLITLTAQTIALQGSSTLRNCCRIVVLSLHAQLTTLTAQATALQGLSSKQAEVLDALQGQLQKYQVRQ